MVETAFSPAAAPRGESGGGGSTAVLWVRHCQACHNLGRQSGESLRASVQRKHLTTALCTLEGAADAVIMGRRIGDYVWAQPSFDKVEIYGSFLPRALETGKLIRFGMHERIEERRESEKKNQRAGPRRGKLILSEEIRPVCHVSEKMSAADHAVMGWRRAASAFRRLRSALGGGDARGGGNGGGGTANRISMPELRAVAGDINKQLKKESGFGEIAIPAELPSEAGCLWSDGTSADYARFQKKYVPEWAKEPKTLRVVVSHGGYMRHNLWGAFAHDRRSPRPTGKGAIANVAGFVVNYHSAPSAKTGIQQGPPISFEDLERQPEHVDKTATTDALKRQTTTGSSFWECGAGGNGRGSSSSSSSG